MKKLFLFGAALIFATFGLFTSCSDDDDSPILSSISVSVDTSAEGYVATYQTGDTLSLTGWTVTANYNDGTTADVTNMATFSPAAGATLSYDSENKSQTQNVTVTYTEDGVTKSTTQEITVTPVVKSVALADGVTVYNYNGGTKALYSSSAKLKLTYEDDSTNEDVAASEATWGDVSDGKVTFEYNSVKSEEISVDSSKSVSDLLTAKVSVSDLLTAKVSVSELYNAGATVAQLLEGGTTTTITSQKAIAASSTKGYSVGLGADSCTVTIMSITVDGKEQLEAGQYIANSTLGFTGTNVTGLSSSKSDEWTVVYTFTVSDITASSEWNDFDFQITDENNVTTDNATGYWSLRYDNFAVGYLYGYHDYGSWIADNIVTDTSAAAYGGHWYGMNNNCKFDHSETKGCYVVLTVHHLASGNFELEWTSNGSSIWTCTNEYVGE